MLRTNNHLSGESADVTGCVVCRDGNAATDAATNQM